MDWHLDPVEKEVFKASPEVLLVSQEDLVEVAHPTDKDPIVDVQLIETARQFCPGEVNCINFYITHPNTQQILDFQLLHEACSDFEINFTAKLGRFFGEIVRLGMVIPL